MKYEVTDAAIEAAQETAISQFGLMLDDDHASAIITAALPHLTGSREIDDEAIHEEMLRRMDLPRYVDQEINPDWLPIDDTQIGVEFAIEYLTNLPSSTGWREIESAPKDGTEVDLWMSDPDQPNGYRIPNARYGSGAWLHGRSLNVEFFIDEVTGIPRVRATHWMPLPPAPDAVKIEPVGYAGTNSMDRLKSKYSATIHPEKAFYTDTPLYGPDAMERITELEALLANERDQQVHEENTELKSRLAVAMKALKFYADVSKYPAPLTGGMGALWQDCGEVATRALTGGQKDG